VDAFDSKEMAGDPERLRQFEEAVGLIDGFRRGRLAASQVFDVDKVACRHAIIDLIGGHHSMDFSDVKFYYDPVARRVEPVAYESFSAFPARTLAGSWRYLGTRTDAQDLHDAWFNDPDLFRHYVHHLERMSAPRYLDSTFAVLGPALDSASAIIYGEFPWKEMDRSIFEHNQRLIRRMLDVPKGFHAHAQQRHGDTLEVLAVPVEQLPLEVHALRLPDGTMIAPLQETIVPARPQARMGVPVRMRFAFPQADDEEVRKMRIVYSVLGASVQKDLELFPFAMPEEEFVEHLIPATTDLRSLDWAIMDEENQHLQVRRGSHVIDRDVVVPAGMKVVVGPGTVLDLRNGARIISRSPLEFSGREDAPVRITSSDGSGTVLVLDAQEESIWQHVEVEWTGGGGTTEPVLTFQGTGLRMRQVKLGGIPTRDMIRLVRTTARFGTVVLAGGRDQVNATYSHVTMENVDAHAAADDGVVLRGGQAMLNNVRMENSSGSAIKAVSGAVVEFTKGTLVNVSTGLEVAEGASFTMEDSKISARGNGVVVKERSMRHGSSHVILKNVTVEAGEERYKIGEGNEVSVDGNGPVPSSHASR
jgi:hypothetical protein